jgi:hypothetical protein
MKAGLRQQVIQLFEYKSSKVQEFPAYSNLHVACVLYVTIIRPSGKTTQANESTLEPPATKSN